MSAQRKPATNRLFSLAGAAAQLGCSRQVLARMRSSGDPVLLDCVREVYGEDGKPCYFVVEERSLDRIRKQRTERR